MWTIWFRLEEQQPPLKSSTSQWNRRNSSQTPRARNSALSWTRRFKILRYALQHVSSSFARVFITERKFDGKMWHCRLICEPFIIIVTEWILFFIYVCVCLCAMCTHYCMDNMAFSIPHGLYPSLSLCVRVCVCRLLHICTN